MNTEIMSFRPDTYWPDSLTPDQLLTRIRGKERQDIARHCLRHRASRRSLNPLCYVTLAFDWLEEQREEA